MTGSISKQADIAIVGGGPVGASLAIALRDSGLEVAVLEARSELSVRDPRALALSQGTRLMLERLAVWDDLAPRATPIESIHVSQRGGFGRALMQAGDFGVPALGYTAEYGDLYDALLKHLPDCGADLITGAQVTGVHPGRGSGRVEYQREGTAHVLEARLLVLADGGKSLPGRTKVKDYGQSAIICTAKTSLPHAGRAYERFTPRGPIALLPLGDAYALVWTTPADQVEARLAWDEATFLAELQQAFGDRQGRFVAAGPRAVYPLRLITTAEPAQAGLVRIGNAAHTLHPVAGQGFNLGIRDAWWLAETALDSSREQLGDLDFLRRYQSHRQRDIRGGVLMTDLLVDLFANDLPVVSQMRGLALTAMDMLPPLKQAFTRKMMFGVQAW